jgi:uncharacterized protein (TIGR03083 family)
MLDFLAHLRRDGARFSEIAHSGDPSARVPSCPDWDLADLVGHLGAVHRVQTQRILSGTAEQQPLTRPTPPSADAVADWYDEGLAALLSALESTDTAAPAWNWSAHAPKTVAFWPRRMAQETAVHRWDAEATVGDVTPIDPELAADGVDEWLTVHLDSDIADPDTEPPPPIGTLHLHSTDAPGEWWAALDGRSLTVVRDHQKADVAARGPAEDLLLMCWRRLPVTAVEVHGDAAVLRAWIDLSEG